MTTTFDGFLRAVKQHYEVAKNGIYSSYLLHPSPAQLRNLCLLLLENKLSKSDEEIFKVFFQVADGALSRRSIEKFDIEKFRPIVNFFKGKSERTNAVTLNLISILVDYQPRPYHKYLKANPQSLTRIETESEDDSRGIRTFVYGLSEVFKEDKSKVSIRKKLISSVGVLLILVFATAFFINQTFISKKECMQWQNDHYEKVDCDIIKQGISAQNDVMPIDNSVINLKKIEVNKQTQFFDNDKPLVWYCKVNGKLSYFNSYGINPETDKPLKPITDYMIKKYVLK